MQYKWDRGTMNYPFPKPAKTKRYPQDHNEPLCFSDLLFTSAHLQAFGFGLLRSRWQPGACQSLWSFQRHSYFLIKDWRSSEGASTKESRFMSSQAGRESGSETVCSSFSLFITSRLSPADPSSPHQIISVPLVISVLQNLQSSHIMRRCNLALYLGH